jgi:hypothetical protein
MAELELYGGALFVRFGDGRTVEVRPARDLLTLKRLLWETYKAFGGWPEGEVEVRGYKVKAYWDRSIDPPQFVAKVGPWEVLDDWTFREPVDLKALAKAVRPFRKL